VITPFSANALVDNCHVKRVKVTWLASGERSDALAEDLLQLLGQAIVVAISWQSTMLMVKLQWFLQKKCVDDL
jgi:hypothetical protein